MDSYDKVITVCFGLGSLILLLWFFNVGGEVMNNIVKWSGLVLIGIGTGYFFALNKNK